MNSFRLFPQRKIDEWRIAFLGVIVVLLTSVLVACPNPASSSASIPDYVGTWSQLDMWGAGTGTVTMTITTTTQRWAVTGGTYNGGWLEFGAVVDEALKHMTVTVTGKSSGPAAFDTNVGNALTVGTSVFYITYAVTGATLQIAASGSLPFPVNATTGSMTGTLTKQ